MPDRLEEKLYWGANTINQRTYHQPPSIRQQSHLSANGSRVANCYQSKPATLSRCIVLCLPFNPFNPFNHPPVRSITTTPPPVFSLRWSVARCGGNAQRLFVRGCHDEYFEREIAVSPCFVGTRARIVCSSKVSAVWSRWLRWCFVNESPTRATTPKGKGEENHHDSVHSRHGATIRWRRAERKRKNSFVFFFSCLCQSMNIVLAIDRFLSIVYISWTRVFFVCVSFGFTGWFPIANANSNACRMQKTTTNGRKSITKKTLTDKN